MSKVLEYGQWLVDHKDEKGSDKFNKVAEAYRLSGGGVSEIEEKAIEPNVMPIFNQARESGFLKGYLDQAAGINQVFEKLGGPGIRETELKLAGIETGSLSDFIEREEAAYQRIRSETGDTGIDWARMAGNLINPVSIGTGMVAAPATGASILSKVGTGAVAGGLALGTHPVIGEDEDYLKSKTTQVAAGAALGGAIPAAMIPLKGAADVAKYLARPFSRAGQLADLKKMYTALAGDARGKIIKSLETATTHVKGNKPTAGQAIAEGSLKLGDDGLPLNFGGSIVKLEQDLSRKASTGDAIKTIYGQHAARRHNAINELIDSGEDALTQAIENRTSATSPFYKIVEESTKKINVKPILQTVKKYQILNKNEDSVINPLMDIQKKLMTNNVPESSPQALHSLSKNISSMMSRKTPGGQNEFDVKVLSEIKKSLDKQIGAAEPAYKMAQNVHKEFSVPVNQIKVSREIGDALENAIKEESPVPFLKAIDNAALTLKKSTGFSRYNKLSDVMNKDQIKVIDQVKRELVRQAREKKLASKTESTIPVMMGEIEPSLPNMLSRPMMLANHVLRKIGQDMGPKYEKLAIKIQENPKELAKILSLPLDDPKRKATTELLIRFNGMIPSQGILPEIEREF